MVTGATNPISTTEESPIITARGVWLPPSGRRTIGLWIVGRCPLAGCSGSHAHRGGPAGGVRRAGCGRGEYLLTSAARRRVVA